MRRIRIAAAALTVAAATVQAQALPVSTQIDRAPDGRIRMSFETRPEVCGDGRSIGEDTPDGFVLHTFRNHGHSIETYEDWLPNCHRGPLRLVVTKSAGRVVDLAAAVGVEWKSAAGVTDLGMVGSIEAATWLLDIAAAGNREVGWMAFLAADVAANAPIADRLFDMAEDEELDSDARERAMRWMNRAAAREGKSDSADEVLRRVARSQGDPRDVRERAIRTLRVTAANDSHLRTLYGQLENRDLKERIIRRLGESPSADNVQWIGAIATTSGEPIALRERAIRVIAGELGRPDDVREMFDRLDHPALKERALRVVADHGLSDAKPWLRTVADDRRQPMDVRERAVRILVDRDGAEARALFAELESLQLKDRALRSAGETHDAGTNEWLRDIAVDEAQHRELRDRAVRILAERAMASSEIAALYDQLNSRELQRRVIRVLAERDDEPAVEKLIRIAESDPDATMRRYAIRRLGEADHPKAKEFLEETVGRRRR